MTVDSNINHNCSPTPTVGVNEAGIQKEEIVIYPNPAKEFISVKTDITEDTQYHIYSILGKLVLSGTVNSQNKRINLPNLSTGLYLFQLENKFTTMSKVNTN